MSSDHPPFVTDDQKNKLKIFIFVIFTIGFIKFYFIEINLILTHKVLYEITELITYQLYIQLYIYAIYKRIIWSLVYLNWQQEDVDLIIILLISSFTTIIEFSLGKCIYYNEDFDDILIWVLCNSLIRITNIIYIINSYNGYYMFIIYELFLINIWLKIGIFNLKNNLYVSSYLYKPFWPSVYKFFNSHRLPSLVSEFLR